MLVFLELFLRSAKLSRYIDLGGAFRLALAGPNLAGLAAGSGLSFGPSIGGSPRTGIKYFKDPSSAPDSAFPP